MADPSNEVCVANTWTKVIAGVTSCVLSALDSNHYRVAMRENPSVAPTSADDGEFMSGQAELRHSVSADLWVYSVGTAGLVRVYA